MMQPSARPVYPRLHRLSLLLEAAQHLLKRPSLLYACCAFPSAGCARKAAPRSACSRTPLLSVTRAYAAAICGAASCLLRLCVSACCARQAAPLHACREAPHVRVHCIEAAADQLPLPLQLLQLASSLQSVLSWDLVVLLHKSLCTYHSAICVAGKAAGPGTHGCQQTLKNMTGSLFESNNHLSQHNIGPKSSPSL